MKKMKSRSILIIAALMLWLISACNQAEEKTGSGPDESSLSQRNADPSMIEAPVKCYQNSSGYLILGANGVGCYDFLDGCHAVSRHYGAFTESAGDIHFASGHEGREIIFQAGKDGSLLCKQCDGCGLTEMVYEPIANTPLIPNNEGKLPWITGRVIAPSGIAMRDKPSQKGIKISSLVVDEIIEIIDTNGPPDTIEGYAAKWVKARSARTQGWVFSGFLESEACACRNLSETIIVEYAIEEFMEASFAPQSFRTEFRIEKKSGVLNEGEEDCFRRIKIGLRDDYWFCQSLSPNAQYMLFVRGIGGDSLKIYSGNEILWEGICKAPSPYQLHWEGESFTFFTIEDTLAEEGRSEGTILQLAEMQFNDGKIRKTGKRDQMELRP